MSRTAVLTAIHTVWPCSSLSSPMVLSIRAAFCTDPKDAARFCGVMPTAITTSPTARAVGQSGGGTPERVGVVTAVGTRKPERGPEPIDGSGLPVVVGQQYHRAASCTGRLLTRPATVSTNCGQPTVRRRHS